MILLKSLIVILIFIILAQLYKKISEYSPKSSEGFRKLYQQNEIFPIAEERKLYLTIFPEASFSNPWLSIILRTLVWEVIWIAGFLTTRDR